MHPHAGSSKSARPSATLVPVVNGWLDSRRGWTLPKIPPRSRLKFVLNAVRRATLAVRWVLRNSFASVAAAWVFALCFASGAVLLGKSPARQSPREFAIAHALWFVLLFAGILQINLALVLVAEQFPGSVGRGQLSQFAWILHRLARSSLPHVVLAAAADALFTAVVHSKLTIYFSALCALHVMACSSAISHRMFKTETVRGRQPRRSTIHPSLSIAATTKVAPVTLASPTPTRVSLQYSVMQSWLRELPIVASSLLAIGYVHGTMALVSTATHWRLAVFIGLSLALKVGLQEAAKRQLLRRRHSPDHSVAMQFIATPSLLIDIQVRIVVLQLGNAAMTAAGTIILALVEVVVRITKMLLVHRQLGASSISRSSTSKIVAQSNHTRSVRSPSTNVDGVDGPPRELGDRMVTQCSRRGRRVNALHAAETYADMYAEYLAMGCSYAVLIVLDASPHYQFHTPLARLALRSSATWVLFALQFVVEVAVDIFASGFEIALGLEVEAAAQNTWSAAAYMVMLGFVNVAVCAGLYMRDGQQL